MSAILARVQPWVGVSFAASGGRAVFVDSAVAGQVVEFDTTLQASTGLIQADEAGGLAKVAAPSFAGRLLGFPNAVCTADTAAGLRGPVAFRGVCHALVDTSAGSVPAGSELFVGESGYLVPGPKSGLVRRAYSMEDAAASAAPVLCRVLFDGDVGFGTCYDPEPPPPVVISGTYSLISDLLLDRLDLYDPEGFGMERPHDGGSTDPSGPLPRPLDPAGPADDCTSAAESRSFCVGEIRFFGGTSGGVAWIAGD